MAIKVENELLVFGIMAANVTVTHARIQKAGADPIVRPLAAPLSVLAGERLRLPAAAMEIVYPSGEVGDPHMEAVVLSYWDGEEFMLDMMTDDSTPVPDANYTQQASDTWTFTIQPD